MIRLHGTHKNHSRSPSVSHTGTTCISWPAYAAPHPQPDRKPDNEIKYGVLCYWTWSRQIGAGGMPEGLSGYSQGWSRPFICSINPACSRKLPQIYDNRRKLASGSEENERQPWWRARQASHALPWRAGNLFCCGLITSINCCSGYPYDGGGAFQNVVWHSGAYKLISNFRGGFGNHVYMRFIRLKIF